MKHSLNPVVTPILPTLDALRGVIDSIDDAILDLLEQRHAVTQRVSRSKAMTSGNVLPIRPQREREILKRLSAKATRVPARDIAHIWRSILTLSARSQRAYRLIRLQFDGSVQTNPLGRGDDVNGTILVAWKAARFSRHPP